MRDLAPSVLRKILTLRQFPILRDAEVGELALFAENVTETVLPAGTVVATAGTRLAALHLVLAGEIAAAGPARRTSRAGHVFGGLEVLANRAAAETAIATTATTTLQLLATDVTDILEDSFGVMLAVLRGLAAAHTARGRRSTRVSQLPEGARTGSLGFVERLMLLRQQPAFATAPLDPLVALAHASEEVALPAGAVVARAGTTETSSYVILEGASSASTASGATRSLGPGDTIGHLEALASQPHDETIEVVAPMRALRVDAPRVFDIIEDHTAFGRAILSALAGDLLTRQLAAGGDAAHGLRSTVL